jgi:hypothetical protein
LSIRCLTRAGVPYVVELAVPDTGLKIELNRKIVGFHKSRRIQPRHRRLEASYPPAAFRRVGPAAPQTECPFCEQRKCSLHKKLGLIQAFG